MSQTCKAVGCANRVRRGVLMCRDHWFSVPSRVRQWVNATWRDWMADRGNADRLADYAQATDEARRFVAEGEGVLDCYVPEEPRYRALAGNRAARREAATRAPVHPDAGGGVGPSMAGEGKDFPMTQQAAIWENVDDE